MLSSRYWGWVRKTGRDLREVPLIIESLRLWRELERDGIETGFRACGVLYVGETDADLARYQSWLDMVQPYQIGSRLIGGADLAAHLPDATRTYRGALYTATDGRAEPQKAVPAIAAAARAAGAGSLGMTLPQLKVLASVMRTAPIDGLPETSSWTSDFAYRRRLDGGYTIANGQSNVVPITPDTFRFFREFLPAARAERRGLRLRLDHRFWGEAMTPKRWALDRPSPFETTRILDPDPVPSINAAAIRSIGDVFPIFRNVAVTQHWAGMIDVTPDVVPVISEMETLPGLVIATGFSGHGFGIGPAAGRLAAEIATGRRTIVDPTPFRYSRFTDGTPITLESGL